MSWPEGSSQVIQGLLDCGPRMLRPDGRGCPAQHPGLFHLITFRGWSLSLEPGRGSIPRLWL